MSNRPLRILLSAYACEPGKGSEPEVGWRWAVELSRLGHEVWVLTRENNRLNIESDASASALPNLHFVYFDLPGWAIRLKRILGTNFYYALWQRHALRIAQELHESVRFDRAQHITFVAARHPSFLSKLGVPYIFGPVAGGECAPGDLTVRLPAKFKLQEAIRSIMNQWLMNTAAVKETLTKAERILVTSEQTRAILPRDFQSRAEISLAITAPPPLSIAHEARERDITVPLKLLYVGRLVFLKGIHLAFLGIHRALQQGAPTQLTLVGDGPDKPYFMQMATDLGIQEHIRWVNWVPREALPAIYEEHDVLLFPSMRDSGGMVVLEAMQYGLPTICLALGGPSVMVDNSCGFAICPDTEEMVVEKLAEAVSACAKNSERYAALSAGTLARVALFDFSQLLKRCGYL